MARPRKTGLDYFPHDCTASHDMKLEAMELCHGLEGYAFYFKLLERIYAGNGLNLLNTTSYGACVKGMGISKKKFDVMLQAAFDCELFERESFENTGEITSDSIRKRIESVNSRRVSGAETMQKPNRNQTGCQVSAELPSREKKSKEKKSKVVVPRAREDDYDDGPTDEEIRTATKRNLDISEVEDAARGIGLTVGTTHAEMINGYLTDYPKDWVLEAVTRTGRAEKQTWNLIEWLLKRWRDCNGPENDTRGHSPPEEPVNPYYQHV